MSTPDRTGQGRVSARYVACIDRHGKGALIFRDYRKINLHARV